jgi:hypothetical protein
LGAFQETPERFQIFNNSKNNNMTENEMKQKEKELKEREDALAKKEAESVAGEKEAPKEKTNFYKIIYLTPVERKGQTLNQNPRFIENGGIYETGDVIELTEARKEALGKKYFEPLTLREFDAWEESGRALKFKQKK